MKAFLNSHFSACPLMTLAFLAVFEFWCCRLAAADISAKTAAQADVAAAVQAAMPGDTVLIPAATAIWTTGLLVNDKSITIQGMGTNQTVIIDELPDRKASLFTLVNSTSPRILRLTGIQFRGGVTNTGENVFGLVRMIGSNTESNNAPWRVDHCLFYHPAGRPIVCYAWSGLIDNCYFDQGGASGLVFDGRLDNERGDRSWATPVQWGTVDAGVYVEHNFFTNSVVRAITDAFAGARFVFRYNTVYNLCVENHGTESTMRARGGRSMEVYGNNFIGKASGAEYAVYLRSGSGLIFSNSISGSYPGFLRMENMRCTDSFTPWGFATGANIWDANSATIYASGTHSGSSGVPVLTDSSASWTANQWLGYSLINTSTGKGGAIAGNTATTITCYTPNFAYNQIAWTSGNGYEIRKVIKALDQPGAGSGTLLSGGSDATSPTPTTWPHQGDEPIRYWNNVGVSTVSASSYVIQAGRDYTNAALPGYTPLGVHPYALLKPSSITPPQNIQIQPGQ